MATVLAQQLTRIAAKSTNSLNLKAQKAGHAKSLLYAPDVAATQDFDSIWLTCSDGYDELCQLDPRFRQFGRTLFSSESKSQDRTLMTAAENNRLNIELEKFMGLIGARLQVKPVLKAFEWLVRRFKVQEYNTSRLLMTLLPLHKSKLFLGLLAILPEKTPDEFAFLYPYRRSLQNPPREAIVKAMVQKHSLFSEFNRFIIQLSKWGFENESMTKFWVAIMAEVIWTMFDKAASGRKYAQFNSEEDVVRKILPIVSQILTMRVSQDTRLGCFALIAAIASKTALGDTVVTALIETVLANSSQDDAQNTLKCLFLLSQNGSQTRFHEQVVERIEQLENPVLEISQCCSAENASQIFLSLAKQLIEDTTQLLTDQRISMIQAIFTSGYLNEGQIQSLIQSVARRGMQFMDQGTTGTNALEADNIAGLARHITFSKETSLFGEEALVKSGLDLELLELKTQTVIRRHQDQADSPDGDVKDVQLLENDKASFDDIVDQMMSVMDQNSFLDVDESGPFDAVLRLFLSALASNRLDDFETLLASRTWASKNETGILSFYIRIWAGPSSVSARETALRLANKQIALLDGTKTDLQHTFPYLICALADPAEAVRQAAAELVHSVSQLYKTKSQIPTDTRRQHIWGESELYGNSSVSGKIRILPSNEIAQIMHFMFLSGLEECTTDAEHIYGLIAGTLKGVSVKDSTKFGKHSKLKSALRATLLEFLAIHTSKTPLVRAKIHLLRALNQVDKVGELHRSTLLLGLLEAHLSLDDGQITATCDRDSLVIANLDREVLAIPTARKGLDMLLNVICRKQHVQRPALHVLAATNIRGLWPKMKVETMVKVAQSLLEASIQDQRSKPGKLPEAASNCLNSLSCPAEVLATLIENINLPPSIASGSQNHNKRKSVQQDAPFQSPHSEQSLEQLLRRLQIVVDLVGAADQDTNIQLLSGLFHLMSIIGKLEKAAGSELLYLQESVLSNIHAAIKKITADRLPLDLSALRVDLLVETFGSSSSVRIQNTILMILSTLAASHADTMLHVAMPIFTFMKRSYFTQNDELSASVIDTAIQQIIPPLVQSFRKQKRDPVLRAADLLINFVAAYPHMPPDRQVHLFVILSKSLGAEDFLFALIVMLIDKDPALEDVDRFVVDLVGQFDCDTQLITMTKYINFATTCMDMQSPLPSNLLKRNLDKPKDRQDLADKLLRAALLIVDQRGLKLKIGKRLISNKSQASTTESLFSPLLGAIIEISQVFQNASSDRDTITELFRSVLKLLNTRELISIVRLMLQQQNSFATHRALLSVEARLSSKNQETDSSREASLAFIQDLQHVVQHSSDNMLAQTAIACIDLICERYGKTRMESVLRAATIVAGPSGLQHVDKRIRTISLVCLTSMTGILQSQIVPLIPQTLPTVLKYLRESIESDPTSQQLHNSALAYTAAILEHTPWVLTQKQIIMLLGVLSQSSIVFSSEDGDQTRQLVMELLPQKVDPMILLGSLDASWMDAVRLGLVSIETQLTLLDALIASSPKALLAKQTEILQRMLLDRLDLRNSLEKNHADFVGEMSISIALKMITKLNDASFGPIFEAMINWMNNDDPVLQANRSLAIYRFCERFFDTFKGLVTNYASHLIEPTLSILRSSKTLPKGASTSVLTQDLNLAMLRALEKSFVNDQSDFWQSPSHFDPFYQELTDRIISSSSEEVVEATIAAIVELAAAADSGDNHKKLNTALLHKLRAPEAKHRLNAIKCQQQITERLGEDWLHMLTEMLPFISELQEDSDEIVERENRKWIVLIEGIMGEDLDDMLS